MHAYRRFLVHFVFSNVFHEVESVVFDAAPASVDVVHHLVVLETALCKKQQHLVSLVSDCLARTSHSHTVCQTHYAVSMYLFLFVLERTVSGFSATMSVGGGSLHLQVPFTPDHTSISSTGSYTTQIIVCPRITWSCCGLSSFQTTDRHVCVFL